MSIKKICISSSMVVTEVIPHAGFVASYGDNGKKDEPSLGILIVGDIAGASEINGH